jgi:molybdopterin-containing oxidoreductase family iron-sulfur binding subunit
LRAGEPSDWERFLDALNLQMPAMKANGGAKLRILTQGVTSPTLYSQLQALLAAYPGAKWSQWEPVTRDNVREGARLAFGQIVEAQYHFDQARVVVALDSDFLFTHPAALRHARQFADGRRVKFAGDAAMNRLYAAEPTPTITGAMAEHRLPVAAGEIEGLATALAAELGVAGASRGPANAYSDWIGGAAKDLRANSSRSIVIAGEGQPPAVHALAHRINDALGNAGHTITYTMPAEPAAIAQLDSLRALTAEMNAGGVHMLVMIGGNPAYDAPADLDFESALEKVRFCVRLGADQNETSRYCHWHIPAAHELEAWSDARAYDGTASITQPLIEPLYQGKTVHELLDAILYQPTRGSYDIVRDYWASQTRGPDFEKTWREALSSGVLPDTDLRPVSVALTASAGAPAAPPASGLEIVFRPDPSAWDGRYLNNAWLQELPRPFTKLTWDNAALISPKLAESEQLENGDVIELRYRGRSVRAPVWIAPGQAENSITVHLGYGRKTVGRIGIGAGFNACALRDSHNLWFGSGAELRKTGDRYPLSATHLQHNIVGRDIVREGTLYQFKANPAFASELFEPRPKTGETLYNAGEFKYPGYKWGMSIDLNVCIGCNACVIACQAENNIPVVGKYEVDKGRAMHWIRIDAYYRGDLDAPEINNQPVPCMQCENAPCELVCPVGATNHDDEGLNVMVFNRCIGTRYCSNNCPYKVRRFNFLEYNAGMTAVQKMVKNPDVTVRSRGVMEKCTYCTQRINAARITAEEQDRKIRDGEILTACQQACPTQAIAFGDLNDPESRVSKLKSQPLDYLMLGELNTRPRTSYLAKLRNPNPELKS